MGKTVDALRDALQRQGPGPVPPKRLPRRPWLNLALTLAAAGLAMVVRGRMIRDADIARLGGDLLGVGVLGWFWLRWRVRADERSKD